MNIVQIKKVGTGTLVLMIAAVFLAMAIAPSWAGASPWADARHAMGMHKKNHPRSILGIWQDQNMVQDLGLTQVQTQQLRDADFKHREKHLALKTQFDQLGLQMDMAFSNSVVDQKAVRQLSQKVADIKGKMFVRKIEERLAFETLLSPDQIQKFKSHRLEQKRKGSKRAMQHCPERQLAGKYLE